MKKTPLDIDKLLDEQDRPRMLGTIERVKDSPERIKFTPYEAHACACSRSVVIPKKAIRSAYETDLTKPCCGKLMRVLELDIDETASVPVSELILNASKHQPVERSAPDSFGFPRARPRHGSHNIIGDDGGSCEVKCQLQAAECYRRCHRLGGPHDGWGAAMCRENCVTIYDGCMGGCYDFPSDPWWSR